MKGIRRPCKATTVYHDQLQIALSPMVYKANLKNISSTKNITKILFCNVA